MLNRQQTSALDDGLTRDWPVQTADTQRNYGYMVQWWAMALAALGFGLYAARRAARPGKQTRLDAVLPSRSGPERPAGPDGHSHSQDKD